MQELMDYYVGKYGSPQREAEFLSKDGKEIKIFKWTEEQTGEGVTMYVTLGASDILGDIEASCEFFIGLTPSADDIVEALAEVALTGNGTGAVPPSGDSLRLAYPLWEGTLAQVFMFSEGGKILPPLVVNGRRVRFIQLVPLFDVEWQYKKLHSEDSLWKVFVELRVPYWKSNREAAPL